MVIHFTVETHLWIRSILDLYYLWSKINCRTRNLLQEFIAYARNMLVPDLECFEANVQSTCYAIEVACKVQDKKIIIAYPKSH